MCTDGKPASDSDTGVRMLVLAALGPVEYVIQAARTLCDCLEPVLDKCGAPYFGSRAGVCRCVQR